MSKVDAKAIHQKLMSRISKENVEVDPIYDELAARLGGPTLGEEKKYVPRILSRLANLEQARIVRALPDVDRDPSLGRGLEVSDTFAEKLGLDKATVDKHIRELFEKGLLFPTRTGPQMARTFVQLHDACLGNPKYDDSLGGEFFDLWGVLEGPKEPPKPEDIRMEGALFRVIPRWKSIENVQGVLPYEDVREILKAQELIVLLHCGCKRSQRDRWCNIPDESCIGLGRTAQYNLDRGVGRKITYDEALEIIEKYDHYPTVNLTVNQKDVNQLICNCHYCCCGAFKEAAKSRFVAEVNPEKCRACKLCLGRCQFGAIQMKFYPEVGGERAYVDPEVCRGCGCCVITCSAEARTMKIVRPAEHIPDTIGIY